MKSIGNVEKLPSSVSFPLSFFTRFLLLANILSLSFPSFLPCPPPRLRTRNDHSSCRPISLNSRGVFTKGVSRKGRGGEEKGKEKKKGERETLESRSSTFTWRRHSGHNYVANRVNEFFPACRISRATRVKSRRRRILRLSEFISGNKRLRHRLRFRFREFVSFVVFSVFPVRDESFFFFSVLFGCN